VLLPSLSQLIEDMRRCRLCQRIAFAVFGAVFIVVSAILVVAAQRYEDDRLSDVSERGRTAVHAMFATHQYAMSAPLLLAVANALSAETLVKGGAIYGADGAQLGIFGEAPRLTPADTLETRSRLSADGTRYDIFWTDQEIGADVMMVARLDSSSVSGQVWGFMAWVVVLVVIMTLFVGAVTLMIVTKSVLSPLVRFRGHIHRMADQLANGDQHDATLNDYDPLPKRNDELGDVFQAFAMMRMQMANGLAALGDRERALTEARSDFETRLAERTKSMSDANAALLKQMAQLERAADRVHTIACLAEEAPDAILKTDEDGVLLFANKAAAPLLAEWKTDVGDPLPERWRLEVENSVESDASEQKEMDVIVDDHIHTLMFQHSPETRTVRLYGRDVTGPKKALAAGLRSAVRDPLTDLASPTVLQDRLERCLAQVAQGGRLAAVHLVNVDQFRTLNEDLGLPGGDTVLKAIAVRLQSCAGPLDTVARLGGDSFVLVQAAPEDADDMAQFAAEILDRVSRPIKVIDQVVHATASIGITALPSDGRDTETVLRHAELALSHAKGDGGGVARFFVARMNESVQKGRAVEGALRRGLDRSEFTVAYQPRRSLRTGRITGAEALVRWDHPDEGLTDASAFLRIAERSGLIGTLGELVLNKSCRLIASSADSGLPNLVLSVNISGIEAKTRDVVVGIKDALAASGIPPSALEIELSEAFCVEDTDTAARLSKGLADLGVAVVIDQVGAGQTGLMAIKRIAPSRLKIAAQVVRSIDGTAAIGQSDGGAVARAVCQLGQAFGVAITAVGVETDAQLRFLRDVGCDDAQGHWIAKPMPGHAVQGFIESHSADIGLNLSLFEGRRSA